MSTHTSGPWHASRATSKHGAISGYWLVRSATGVQVADLFGLTGEQDADGDDAHISDDESCANAHLIEAAPDLLEACEALLAERPDTENFFDWLHAREEQICAAIRKARNTQEQQP